MGAVGEQAGGLARREDARSCVLNWGTRKASLTECLTCCALIAFIVCER